jgi:hypothetical protein
MRRSIAWVALLILEFSALGQTAGARKLAFATDPIFEGV